MERTERIGNENSQNASKGTKHHETALCRAQDFQGRHLEKGAAFATRYEVRGAAFSTLGDFPQGHPPKIKQTSHGVSWTPESLTVLGWILLIHIRYKVVLRSQLNHFVQVLRDLHSWLPDGLMTSPLTQTQLVHHQKKNSQCHLHQKTRPRATKDKSAV